MGFRILAIVFVVWVSGTAFGSQGASAPAKPKNAAAESVKQSELTWARGVADDFLAAWMSGNNAQAEMLVTEEMKQRYAKYPQCTPLAQQLLEAQYAGLTRGGITQEQIAPAQDEARFTGKPQGERNQRPIEADFALRVVKEAGKWRISFFRQQWRWVDAGSAPAK